MRITSLDIQEQKFRVVFRGFDPGEVDTFLQRLADEWERLVEERERLEDELEEEKRTRRTLEGTLEAARAVQEELLEKARGEAELAVHQAQLRADRILAKANEELVGLRREILDLNERRSAYLTELAALADGLRTWVEQRTAEGEPAPPTLLADEEPQEDDELGG
ncbi:MAG: DivIVA domain-containing protein [Deltaproteobacteria bacterium]|nr:DivIVA domain-containing protein [Deltaproteobacteria bacterium]